MWRRSPAPFHFTTPATGGLRQSQLSHKSSKPLPAKNRSYLMALRTPAATPRLLDTIAAIWGFDPNEPFQEEDEDDVKREPSAETWNSTSTEKRDTYQEPPAATPPAAPPIFEGIEDISDAEEETPSLFKAGLDAAEDLDLDAPEPLAVDEEPSEPNAEDHSSGTIHEQPIPEPKAPSEEEYVIPLHERIKVDIWTSRIQGQR